MLRSPEPRIKLAISHENPREILPIYIYSIYIYIPYIYFYIYIFPHDIPIEIMVKIPRLPGPPDPSSPPLVEISMQPRQTWQRHAFPVPTAVRLLVASQGLDVVAR